MILLRFSSSCLGSSPSLYLQQKMEVTVLSGLNVHSSQLCGCRCYWHYRDFSGHDVLRGPLWLEVVEISHHGAENFCRWPQPVCMSLVELQAARANLANPMACTSRPQDTVAAKKRPHPGMTPPAASSRRFLASSVSSAFFSLWAMERGTSTIPVIHADTSSWFTFCVCSKNRASLMKSRETNM